MNASPQPAVTVSAYGHRAASTRVRIHDWFAHLDLPYEHHGYIGGSANGAGTLIRRLPSVLEAEDGLRTLSREVAGRTLLLSRQASPFSNGRVESALLSRAGRGVYDFDDALFNDRGGLTRRIWSKVRVWEESVRAADVVIAGSEFLADAASGISENVVMIPSCVEPSAYTAKSAFELGKTPRGVWIGTPATEPLLTSISGPLLELNRRFGLRLTVISAGENDLGELGSMVDRMMWTEEGFPSALADADFGIMPLTDTPFTRGKCAYKLLQYAAAGLPLIGSPVGANEKALDLLGGLAATTPSEWFEAGATILEMSASARAAAGAHARTAVTKHYSFGAWEVQWLAATGLDRP